MGQVTIPVELREKAGLFPNTDVEFEWDGEYVRILPGGHAKKETRGQMAVRLLRGAKHFDMTTDEVMALTRGE